MLWIRIRIRNTEYSFKKIFFFKQDSFSLKLFLNFSFKIDSITLDLDPDRDLDPDPNCAKIQDPDPNSMYLDPQH